MRLVIRVLFPKHDYDAWCVNSKLPTKKNATSLSLNFTWCGRDVAHMPQKFPPISKMLAAFFYRACAFQARTVAKSSGESMKFRQFAPMFTVAIVPTRTIVQPSRDRGSISSRRC